MTPSRMKLAQRLITGALYGLVAGSAWFLVEGFYTAAGVAEVPLWAAPLTLGVGAPLVAVVAVLGSGVFFCWGQLVGRDDPVRVGFDAAWRWASRGSPEAQSWRCAWTMALPALLGLWLAGGIFATRLILGGIKTTGFAGALIVVVNLLGAAFLAGVSPVLVVPLQRLFGVSSRARIGRWIRAWHLAGAMVLAAGVGLVLLWRAYPDVLPHLPWNFALSAVAALCALGLSSWLVGGTAGLGATKSAAVVGLVLVALGTLTAYLPSSLVRGRAVFADQTSVASAWHQVLEDALDYDGDRTLHLYGGQDCAPHDASRSPRQTEIVANGVDDNCSGADLNVELTDFDTGKLAHRRPEDFARRPNIVLITTDALSQRHTTLGGYERDTTPRLAQWAERATVFEHGFALSSSTRLAMSGLVAGTFNSLVPMKKGRIHPYAYAKDAPSLVPRLQEQGYKTVFVPGHKYFLPRRWKGYTRGFDVIDDKAYKEAANRKHTGPKVTERALKYLREHDGDEPLFLWVHYYDHHSPYRTPEGHRVFEGDKKLDHYDNEIRFADEHWAQVIEAVEAKWAPREYLMAFTADHGEAFDKRHTRHHHGYGLDTEVLHVPFIIQGPTRRGERVDGLVSHADLVATFANVVGIEPDESWLGESLVAVLFDGAEVQKQILYSLFYIPEAIRRGEDGFEQIGVRTDDFALVEDLKGGKRRLTAWKEDPVGNHDLAEERRDILEIYRHLASKKLEWLRAHERALSHLRDDQ